MPTDSENSKWACEACVRGHRATRCDHFDRWMVRVKKPGRPLRDCPHVTVPCSCTDDKVIMMRIPKREQRGNCNCRVQRVFDPTSDDEGAQPSRRPPRIQDPLDPSRTVPYQNVQPIQQFPGQTDAQSIAFYQHIMSLSVSTRTANGQSVGAEPSHSLPLRDGLRTQQPIAEPSPSDQSTPAATPTAPTRRGQVPHQEQSHSVGQAYSPTTVQGVSSPSPVRPDSNVNSNHYSLSRPQDWDAAYHQPRTPASYSVIQPAMNGRSMPDPAHFERLGYPYPPPGDPYPIISAAVPSTEFNALTNSNNCQCGPGCTCVYCATHPYNDATRERVHDLNQIMTMDNYWAVNPVSPPPSRYGVAPTNGTNIEPVMGQGYPPLDEGPFPSAASEWTNAPIQGPELQPTFDEGASVDSGDYFNDFSPRTMRNSGYFTMEYPVNNNCTDATGMCQCGSDCRCSGCLTHQGHNGLPN